MNINRYKIEIMKTLSDFVAQQLSKSQMNNLKGGVTREEYCKILDGFFEHQMTHQTWTEQEWINATTAWNTYCA